jgi:hypothetical protein
MQRNRCTKTEIDHKIVSNNGMLLTCRLPTGAILIVVYTSTLYLVPFDPSSSSFKPK